MGNEFFSQDCADDDSLVSMEFSLDIGGDIRSVSIEGSEVLPSHQCDFIVELMVKYGKGEWKKEVTAFTRTMPGSNTVQDTLTLESGNIVKTVNPCQEGELELTVDAVTFPGDVAAPQSVSEMGWKGCSDHNVTMRRGGNIVSEIVIPHPGWEKVLTVLEEVNKTDTNITFKQPEEKCDDNKFKIEIVCEAIESEDAVSEEKEMAEEEAEIASEEKTSEDEVSEVEMSDVDESEGDVIEGEVSEGEVHEEEVFKGETFEEEVSEDGASEWEGFGGEAPEAEMSEDVYGKELSKREVSEEYVAEGEEVSNEINVESYDDETIKSDEPTNETNESNESEEATNESQEAINEGVDETNEKEEAINEDVENMIESEESINETEEVIKETNEVSKEFKFEDILQVTNLSPETSYECKGRLVNIENGGTTQWSKPVRVTTDKEQVIEEEILEEETEPIISTDSEAFGSDDNDVVEAILNPVDPVVDVDVEPRVEGGNHPDAAVISNALAAVDSEETEADAISEEHKEEIQEPVEPRKAGASGLIIGLIVCGLLTVLLVAMVVTWRKRSNVKNHQPEEPLPENSPDDCVKVEMNDSMTTDEPAEILTPVEAPQNDKNEVNDPVDEVKITMESSENDEANSAAPTNPVDETSPDPNVETPVVGDSGGDGGDADKEQ